MVYFIEAVGVGLVKIGFTDGEPEVRLRQLQTGCPHKLRLRMAFAAERSVEQWCHEKFGHLRTGGEWFQLTLEIEAFIAAVRWVWPKQDRIEARLDRIEARLADLESRGISVDLADDDGPDWMGGLLDRSALITDHNGGVR